MENGELVYEEAENKEVENREAENREAENREAENREAVSEFIHDLKERGILDGGGVFLIFKLKEEDMDKVRKLERVEFQEFVLRNKSVLMRFKGDGYFNLYPNNKEINQILKSLGYSVKVEEMEAFSKRDFPIVLISDVWNIGVVIAPRIEE